MRANIKQIIILLAISTILGIASNLFSGNGIAFVGDWPSLISESDSIIKPPSAEEGDPPFISLDEAAGKYQDKNVLFIDARDPEDFELAHIKGAVSIPYEYLEDDWDAMSSGIPEDRPLVIYCSGSECELSLLLGREMAYQGYKSIFIFYGGWREWEHAGLPVERSD